MVFVSRGSKTDKFLLRWTELTKVRSLVYEFRNVEQRYGTHIALEVKVDEISSFVSRRATKLYFFLSFILSFLLAIDFAILCKQRSQ